ncbi:MAG: Ni/Fe hydrogenase subunit alpha [Candidatus Njordarchaeales archaeon]
MKINLEGIARLVGHIDLNIEIRKDQVEAELSILNDPRFIEALVIGKKYSDVAEITSRICGPCSISHTFTPIIAIERAMGVEVPEDVKQLRETATLCEIAENHIVHLSILTLPDYMGCKSTVELAKKYPKLVKDAITLRQRVTQVGETLVGRLVHPNACVVGGFTRVPNKIKLEKARDKLREALKFAKEMADVFMNLEYPELLVNDDLHSAIYDGYNFIGDNLVFSNGQIIDAAEYNDELKERPVSHSTSKRVTSGDKPVYVGARARINLRWKDISDLAKAYVEQLKLPLRNPYDNVRAQAIEVLHCVDSAIRNLDNLAAKANHGNLKGMAKVNIRAGEGVGLKEAPRGVLIHHYRINEEGIVTYANIITPTTINSRHMEVAAEQLVCKYMENGISEDKLKFDLERLIRAYDPCLGCATHVIKVNIRRCGL